MPENLEVDVVVIGGGPSGEEAAGRCADGGLTVALVESELLGGECEFWACMPSKTLLRPGAIVEAARRVPGARAAVTGGIDVAAALRWRDEVTHHWRDDSDRKWVNEHRIMLVRGRGKLSGERTVQVESKQGKRTLTAKKAVILATGSSPFRPPIPGLDEVRTWTSRDATSAKSAPKRMLVMGGGPVGVELSQAWKSLGTKEVTLVEHGPRLLGREEPFAAEMVERTLTAAGVHVLLGRKIVSTQRAQNDGGVLATLDDGTRIESDVLLLAAGRRPNTTGLGLETLGLQGGQRLEVDEQLRVRGVAGGWLHAIGDANGGVMLTHMAKYQARIVGDHLLGKEVSALALDRVVPRVVFTDPEVASVGLTEEQARQRGIDVGIVRYNIADVGGSTVLGESATGTAQLVIDNSKRVIVGATFTGYDVAEMIHSATIAITGEVTLDRLWHAVPVFPTVSEVWLRLLQAYGV